jgi:hypothetical protein
MTSRFATAHLLLDIDPIVATPCNPLPSKAHRLPSVPQLKSLKTLRQSKLAITSHLSIQMFYSYHVWLQCFTTQVQEYFWAANQIHIYIYTYIHIYICLSSFLSITVLAWILLKMMLFTFLNSPVSSSKNPHLNATNTSFLSWQISPYIIYPSSLVPQSPTASTATFRSSIGVPFQKLNITWDG